jgi:hypothetical protein
MGRARYVAERHVIAERYAEFEIIAPPEVRNVDPHARHFNPRSAPSPRKFDVLGKIMVAASASHVCRLFVLGADGRRSR